MIGIGSFQVDLLSNKSLKIQIGNKIILIDDSTNEQLIDIYLDSEDDQLD